jgi:GTPase SAR1 family protein
LDTAGQETFSAMRELYYKNGEAFALCYSITSQKSFDDLEQIMNGIVKYRPRQFISFI